jgi:hypothetical protein
MIFTCLPVNAIAPGKRQIDSAKCTFRLAAFFVIRESAKPMALSFVSEWTTTKRPVC